MRVRTVFLFLALGLVLSLNLATCKINERLDTIYDELVKTHIQYMKRLDDIEKALP